MNLLNNFNDIIWNKWSINRLTDWAAQFLSKSRTLEGSVSSADPLEEWSSYSVLSLITHPLCLMSCSTDTCKCLSSQHCFLMAKSVWLALGSTACRSLRLPMSRPSRPILLRLRKVHLRKRRSEINQSITSGDAESFSLLSIAKTLNLKLSVSIGIL